MPVNVFESGAMYFLFNETSFSKSMEYKGTANSGFPLPQFTGSDSTDVLSPEESSVTNSEISSKILSTGAHRCYKLDKDMEKRGDRKGKNRKNMKFKNQGTKRKYPKRY